MCKAANPWALAYLRGQPWAVCAKLPGLDILQAHADATGNFMYPYADKQAIEAVYAGCTPVCASEDDVYHSASQMCIVRNPIANMWLRGQGQQCSAKNKGSKVITKSSGDERQNAYVYPPNYSKAVTSFYETCVATCAVGDALSADGVHCKVLLFFFITLKHRV